MQGREDLFRVHLCLSTSCQTVAITMPSAVISLGSGCFFMSSLPVKLLGK